jgi:Rrf2 family protein
MLDLSRQTVWALYALHFLSGVDRLASTREIARHGGVPKEELSEILRKLGKAGLIHGRRGHGYRLAVSPQEISVHAVAQVFEDPSAPLPSCIRRYDACAYHESCPLAPLCIEAHARVEEATRSFNLADLRLSPARLADCAAAPRKRALLARPRSAARS